MKNITAANRLISPKLEVKKFGDASLAVFFYCGTAPADALSHECGNVTIGYGKKLYKGEGLMGVSSLRPSNRPKPT